MESRCFICNTQIPNGELICDNKSCIRKMKEFKNYERDKRRKENEEGTKT